MYCGQCGTRNNDEAGTCESCGSPLLISAGARNCESCGGSIGDTDQFCPSCGHPATSTSQTYDADDSFDSISADDIQLDELPDWLRDMAGPQDQPGQEGVASGQAEPDDLPAWLQDPEGGSSPDVSAGPAHSGRSSEIQHQPAEQFSLVGDEDLPEWLRALGDDESSSEQPPEPASASSSSWSSEPSDSRAVATLFDIPPVTRAWLEHGRVPNPEQIAAARQEFEALSVAAGRPEEQPLLAESRPAETIDWEQTTGAANDSTNESSSSGLRLADGGVSRIVKLVVLAILIVILLALLFLLFQEIA